MSRGGSRLRVVAAVCVAVSSAGCAVGPGYEAPGYSPAAEFPEDELWSRAAEPELDWWTAFEDAVLAGLVADSFERNHDLRIAEANLAASRALLREGRFVRYPIVTAEGSATRTRRTAVTQIPGQPSIDEIYDASLDLNWELDFFGRVRRSVEALKADYEAAVATLRFAYVRIAGEVAASYVDLRGAQNRLAVARRNAANQRDTYELTEALLEGGRGTALDIARARAQLESTLARIPALEAEIRLAMHRLSVLAGEAPAKRVEALSPEVPLPAVTEPIAIGDPAALLRRRPDVAAAERELAAATARVGVSVADLFPRVTLLGSGGYLARSLDELGNADTETFSIGPRITWSALDFARVRAQIDAAKANADAELARYEQAVLTALREVEDALERYRRGRESLARYRNATEASREAARLSRLRYRAGADSFLTVLDAERRQLEAEDQLSLAETGVARSVVALYKALGGGWQAAAPAER